MEPKKQVLKAMQQKATPLGAGEIAEITSLDKKLVDKAMKLLKTEEAIFSPVRCKWQAK